MSSAVTLFNIQFDPSDASDSQKIGSYVLAGDDGAAIGHVSDALKVSLTNASLTVSATNLDIRDLVFATDKVDVSGSSVSISGSVTVTATDLDIRDLTHASDSVKIGDGTDFLAINGDGSLNVAQAAFDTVANDELTVGTTEVELVAASPVANRRYLLIQNQSSSASIYVGATGLATTDGIEIPKKGNLALDASGGVYAIAGSAGHAVRILELGLG